VTLEVERLAVGDVLYMTMSGREHPIYAIVTHISGGSLHLLASQRTQEGRYDPLDTKLAIETHDSASAMYSLYERGYLGKQADQRALDLKAEREARKQQGKVR
jgi:hypothetical protein